MTKTRRITIDYCLTNVDDKYEDVNIFECYLHICSLIEQLWTQGYDVKVIDDNNNVVIIICDINRKKPISFKEQHKLKQELNELFDSTGYGVDYCHTCDQHTPFEYNLELLKLDSRCKCGTRRIRSFLHKKIAEKCIYN